jgi:proteasome lid subunit RPN8/RPN11
MDFRDVFIGKRSFKTLIASAIEVYSRETNGALLGRNTTMNIDGVKKKVLSIKDVYPIQTEKRKRSEVSHGNIAAFERFLRAMKSLKTNMVGGFHSHPHPYEGNTLSKGDVEFVRDEVKVMSKTGQRGIEKGWLEVLISIRRKNYKRVGMSKWYTCSYIKKVGCKVRTQKRVGYDIIVSAYWVYPKKIVKKKIQYGVKEAAVYVPWIVE